MNQPEQPNENDPGRMEQVSTQHVTARVPDNVRSVFSTGAIVMTGNSEFVIDFIQCVGRPRQVAARVVMPHAVMPQFITALQKNLEIYTSRFGEPPPLPKPQTERRPSVQEIYDDLKLPDEVMSGAYANGVMIGHAASEFGFDFLTNFFPHSAVSCRVFLAAPQVPRLLETLSNTFAQFKRRVQQQREQMGQNPPPADMGPPPHDQTDIEPPPPPPEDPADGPSQ